VAESVVIEEGAAAPEGACRNGCARHPWGPQHVTG
jgi:hypothetical protein